MRKPFVRIPQFEPIGNDSIKWEKKINKHFTQLHLVVCPACVVWYRREKITKKRKRKKKKKKKLELVYLKGFILFLPNQSKSQAFCSLKYHPAVCGSIHPVSLFSVGLFYGRSNIRLYIHVSIAFVFSCPTPTPTPLSLFSRSKNTFVLWCLLYCDCFVLTEIAMRKTAVCIGIANCAADVFYLVILALKIEKKKKKITSSTQTSGWAGQGQAGGEIIPDFGF